MGLSSQQIQVGIDFEKREIIFAVRKPLDINPTVVRVPFGVFKGVAATLIKAEAEDELTLLTKVGDALADEAKKD